MAVFLLLAVVWTCALSDSFTFSVSQCFEDYPWSKVRAQSISARPYLMLRSSNLRCWGGAGVFPGPQDDVVIDFEEESPSGFSFITVDQPVSWQSLTIRRSHRIRHSSVVVFASVTVQGRITVPAHVIFHLNASVTAGSFALGRAGVLTGDGLLQAGEFTTAPGSFISPGRLFVSMCGGMCFQSPPRVRGVGYGALKIVVTKEADADLSGATVLLKAIGVHPSFGNRTYDMLAVNRATFPARTMLMLGAATNATQNFPAEAYPPIEAVCIASGKGGAAYSPKTEECLAFAVENGLSTMRQWPAGLNAKQQWRSLRPRVISSARNWVPFALRSCCGKAMVALLHKVPSQTPELERQVRDVERARIVTLLERSRLLRERAPKAVKKLYRRVKAASQGMRQNAMMASASSLSPQMAALTNESDSLMAQALSVQQGSCVPSTTILISLNPQCCPDGFTGPGCDMPVPCACSARGVCTITNVCLCNPGFTGADCSVPVCPTDAAGRVCGGPVAGTCTYDVADLSDVPSCDCNVPFSGSACEVALCSPPCDSVTQTCEARGFAPVCWNKPASGDQSCPVCLNGGTCVNSSCVCTSEFEGPQCQSPVCPSRCSGNGVCYIDDRNHASCNCMPRFTGIGCETEVCTPERCQNGGVCISGPSCQCPVGFGGPFCQERIFIANRNTIFAGSALSDGALLAIIIVCSLLAASLVVFFIVNYRLRMDARHVAEFNASEKAKLLGAAP